MRTYQKLIDQACDQRLSIGKIVLQEEMAFTGQTAEAIRIKMLKNLQVMKESVGQGLTGEWRSPSGLVGGDAIKLDTFRLQGRTLLGQLVNQAAARAIAVAEVNAGMGRIVAAPTAGACGVLPGVLLTVGEIYDCSQEQVIDALFTAAGLGMVIADRASVSGAQGGCQAEIGSAASMAAAAVVQLVGGTPEETGHAAAMALKSMLGLVCDPVAGLVEVPCVKRNASGAVVALLGAEMALAGVRSAIPIDEVIDAMASIGRNMPCSLKETAQGGLAMTPTGLRVKNEH